MSGGDATNDFARNIFASRLAFGSYGRDSRMIGAAKHDEQKFIQLNLRDPHRTRRPQFHVELFAPPTTRQGGKLLAGASEVQ